MPPLPCKAAFGEVPAACGQARPAHGGSKAPRFGEMAVSEAGTFLRFGPGTAMERLAACGSLIGA